MITGVISIATTWEASTSFIPFHPGMRNAQDFQYGGVPNRGIFATTAYVTGVWERQLWEEGFKRAMEDDPDKFQSLADYRTGGIRDEMRGLGGGGYGDIGNAFDEGTVITVKVRKLKALKNSPNRSGIQVNRRLVAGNKLVFRYVAEGELVRPV